MKHTNTFFALVALFAISLFSASWAETYTVVPSKTNLKWTGTKAVGEHYGSLKVQSGNLVLEGNSVKSGEFTIDMNSLTVDDMEPGEWHDKLLGHLKADDFFATNKYSSAKFVITNVKSEYGNMVITGDLTIKGKTHPVTFATTLNTQGNTSIFNAKITVNRIKYGIEYSSGSFFENLGDKLIHDNFTIDLKLVTNKG
jgi:polyisoprenoid-binding protein YceI